MHTTGFVPEQMPAWQVSVCVQALPSLHATPSVAAGFEHTPVAGLHVPATWHWSWAVHKTGFVPVQVPAWQLSICVQPFASLQATPSALFGFEQAPVTESHVPATWHWSCAEHTTGSVPVQAPA